MLSSKDHLNIRLWSNIHGCLKHQMVEKNHLILFNGSNLEACSVYSNCFIIFSWENACQNLITACLFLILAVIKKKINLGKCCCLLVTEVLTFSFYMMFDNLNLESWRLLTYILRFKDYMKEDSKEIHVASTKQLNIKLAKERGKRNFYSQAAISLKKLQTPNGNSFCNILLFADKSNTSV